MTTRNLILMLIAAAFGYTMAHINLCSEANARSRTKWEYHCVQTFDKAETHRELAQIANELGAKGYRLAGMQVIDRLWCFERQR